MCVRGPDTRNNMPLFEMESNAVHNIQTVGSFIRMTAASVMKQTNDAKEACHILCSLSYREAVVDQMSYKCICR